MQLLWGMQASAARSTQGVILTGAWSVASGLAFSELERERLYLRGLLPPAVLSQDVQAERAMINIRSKSSDLERHSYLTSLQVLGRAYHAL